MSRNHSKLLVFIKVAINYTRDPSMDVTVGIDKQELLSIRGYSKTMSNVINILKFIPNQDKKPVLEAIMVKSGIESNPLMNIIESIQLPYEHPWESYVSDINKTAEEFIFAVTGKRTM